MQAHFTLAPGATDRDGIAKAQTTAGAADLALDGDLAGVLDVPRRVSIYSAADLHLITFTVYGTDRVGNAFSEARIGPTAGATVLTTANFKTVTRVAADAAVGTSVEIGAGGTLESAWIPMDPHRVPFSWSVIATVSAGASVTWGLQWTLMPISSLTESQITAFADDATITAKTATLAAMSTTTGPAVAMRVTCAWVSGTVDVYLMQN